MEPEGTVEIKYRERDLTQTMNRLDATCALLVVRLADLSKSLNPNPNPNLKPNLNPSSGTETAVPTVKTSVASDRENAADAEETRKQTVTESKKEKEKESEQLQAELRRRQQDLLPAFQQVALHFVDLHDTPLRMLRKGSSCVHYLIYYSFYILLFIPFVLLICSSEFPLPRSSDFPRVSMQSSSKAELSQNIASFFRSSLPIGQGISFTIIFLCLDSIMTHFGTSFRNTS